MLHTHAFESETWVPGSCHVSATPCGIYCRVRGLAQGSCDCRLPVLSVIHEAPLIFTAAFCVGKVYLVSRQKVFNSSSYSDIYGICGFVSECPWRPPCRHTPYPSLYPMESPSEDWTMEERFRPLTFHGLILRSQLVTLLIRGVCYTENQSVSVPRGVTVPRAGSSASSPAQIHPPAHCVCAEMYVMH